MTDLYPCKLCGSEAQEPTLVFKATRCGNAECPMHMTWVPDRQWQALMPPDWRPIEEAPRPDDNPETVLVLRKGRRFIAEYDACSGYFFAFVALDGVEWGSEFPGRLYSAEKWMPLPSPPKETT